MGFTKEKLPIQKKGDIVEYVDGYTFNACFSNGQLFKVGVFNNGLKWIVTEINTGLAICYSGTRKGAVKLFQDVYLSKLERYVEIDDYNISVKHFDVLKAGVCND